MPTPSVTHKSAFSDIKNTNSNNHQIKYLHQPPSFQVEGFRPTTTFNPFENPTVTTGNNGLSRNHPLKNNGTGGGNENTTAQLGGGGAVSVHIGSDIMTKSNAFLINTVYNSSEITNNN